MGESEGGSLFNTNTFTEGSLFDSRSSRKYLILANSITEPLTKNLTQSVETSNKKSKLCFDSSVWSAARTLVGAVLGTSILTTPNGLAQIGWAVGLGLLAFSCLSQLGTHYLLAHCIVMTPKAASYSEMITQLFSKVLMED